MQDDEKLNKAINKIDELFKVRDDLNKASPYLNDLKARAIWYQNSTNEIPEEKDALFRLIEEPIENILLLSATNLNFDLLSGATGSFYSVSGDTRLIINNHRKDHYALLESFDHIKETESLVDEIEFIINQFRQELKKYGPGKLLIEAKLSYMTWKSGANDNSVLAKDIRAFQDVFKGCLRDAWVSKEKLKDPDFSWPKMAESLGKSGGGCKNSLRNLQNKEGVFHDDFSEILKKTKSISKEEMDELFKAYIEHLYAIINLIDINIMD
jgi:hypothetical protein